MASCWRRVRDDITGLRGEAHGLGDAAGGKTDRRSVPWPWRRERRAERTGGEHGAAAIAGRWNAVVGEAPAGRGAVRPPSRRDEIDVAARYDGRGKRDGGNGRHVAAAAPAVAAIEPLRAGIDLARWQPIDNAQEAQSAKDGERVSMPMHILGRPQYPVTVLHYFNERAEFVQVRGQRQQNYSDRSK
jgi:hypothetical protein